MTEMPMARADTPLHLDRMLCFQVYAAQHAFNAAYKPLLDPLGLSYPQYLVLLALWEQDGVSVKEIGARLSLDSGTLTPLLKRLEAAGFLTRRRAAEDERRLVVKLTERGKSLRDKAVRIRESLASTLGGTGEAMDALLQELKRITPRLRGAKEEAGAG